MRQFVEEDEDVSLIGKPDIQGDSVFTCRKSKLSKLLSSPRRNCFNSWPAKKCAIAEVIRYDSNNIDTCILFRR